VLKKLAVLGPNTMFGEMSLVGIVTASVIAEERSEIHAMQLDVITSLFQSEAGLSMRFWCKVAQGLASILVSLAPPPKKEIKDNEPRYVKAEEDPVAETSDSRADAILAHKFGLENQVVMKRTK
jgi:hypothetical protein